MRLSAGAIAANVAAEDLPRVTDRFHRVAQHGRSFEGTGIGLALAIELVQLHGGSMAITSQTREQSPSGHGSQFRVRMPWGYQHLPRSAVNPDGAIGNFGGYGRGLIEEAMQWMTSSRDTNGSRASASGSVEDNSDAGTSGDNPTKGFDKSTFYFEKVGLGSRLKLTLSLTWSSSLTTIVSALRAKCTPN